MNYFKVNDEALPPIPVGGVNYQENDLQSKAYRDESGKLHKSTVRWGVRKFELKWNSLNNEEISLLRRLLKSSEYFKFEYFCDNNNFTGIINEAYAGDITYTLYNAKNNNGIWKGVKVSIIER